MCGIRTAVAAVIWLCCVAGSAGAAEDCESFRLAGYKALHVVSSLSTPEVGFGHPAPLPVLELICILRRPDAADVLVELTEEAAKAGQLFALTGLYLADRKRFQQLAPRFATDKSTITFVDGELISERTVADIVTIIARGHYPDRFRHYMTQPDKKAQ